MNAELVENRVPEALGGQAFAAPPGGEAYPSLGGAPVPPELGAAARLLPAALLLPASAAAAAAGAAAAVADAHQRVGGQASDQRMKLMNFRTPPTDSRRLARFSL